MNVGEPKEKGHAPARRTAISQSRAAHTAARGCWEKNRSETRFYLQADERGGNSLHQCSSGYERSAGMLQKLTSGSERLKERR